MEHDLRAAPGSPAHGLRIPPALVADRDPQLHPAYTTCLTSYWYQFDNNRGHKAYLTLNVHDPADSTNSGEWHPAIPQTGYYRVEAYIPAHGPIAWCSSGNIKDHDTTNARYTIHHAYGETTVAKSQYPLSNQWWHARIWFPGWL